METFEDRYVFVPSEPRSGGLSVVRKAFDVVDAAEVAIKFVGASTDQLTRLIFERELDTLQALSHQNIIRLRNSGIEKETGAFYLVFDWIEESLANILAQGITYNWEELVPTIAEPLASALSHAHIKQVEHRDIKPANVLMTQQGRPLLADFGIAKLRGDLRSSEITVAGFRSGPYTPPEADSRPYLRDVYSMGVLLIQTLYQDKIRDFHEIAPALESIDVPSDARRLLEKCVDPDPSVRPLNGMILLEELIQCSTESQNRRAARKNVVILKLTNASRRSLLPEKPEEAGPVVMSDLAGEVFAEFRFDHDRKTIDRNTIFLIGDSWRLTLKPDEQAGAFVITAARQFEFEILEAMRRRSMPIGKTITWAWRPPGDIAMAMSGLEILQRSLEDFEDSKISAREEALVRVDEDELFDAWLRLLQAQEELARGERQPLRYQRRHVRRREADFTLYTPTELDLVGTEVEVVVDETRRKIARGEIIAQYDDQITVRSRREFPPLPDKATLAPYLGPTNVALQRQADAVSAIKNGSASRPDLREMVLDPSIVSAPVPVVITAWNRDLDQSKRDAVSAALGAPDFLLVQGPPGTGKTSFITETVAQTLRQKPDSRILIVSQTHVAVDNSLERLDKAGVRGLVRLGIPDGSQGRFFSQASIA